MADGIIVTTGTIGRKRIAIYGGTGGAGIDRALKFGGAAAGGVANDNKHVNSPHIHFCSDGSGQGVCWHRNGDSNCPAIQACGDEEQ